MTLDEAIDTLEEMMMQFKNEMRPRSPQEWARVIEPIAEYYQDVMQEIAKWKSRTG